MGVFYWPPIVQRCCTDNVEMVVTSTLLSPSFHGGFLTCRCGEQTRPLLACTEIWKIWASLFHWICYFSWWLLEKFEHPVSLIMGFCYLLFAWYAWISVLHWILLFVLNICNLLFVVVIRNLLLASKIWSTVLRWSWSVFDKREMRGL